MTLSVIAPLLGHTAGGQVFVVLLGASVAPIVCFTEPSRDVGFARPFLKWGEIPVHLIYVSYSIETGLVSMIGMFHFPTGGPIASLTRF
jgi:hypothetical protein